MPSKFCGALSNSASTWLSGDGTVGNLTIASSGGLEPGAPPQGTLNFLNATGRLNSGSATFQPDSVFYLRLNGPSVDQYHPLHVTGTVTLNAMETSMLEGPVLFLESEPLRMKHVQILLVEDHEDTARVLGRILRNAGFDVSHAGTVAEARALAGTRPFDLLISDVGLPDGSGLDLMKALRDAQGMKGIALSGFGTDEDVTASAAAGFAAHITKPVDWDRLRAEIEKLTAGRDSAARSAA